RNTAMNPLYLDMFISAHRDYEASRYRILSGIQKIRNDFSQNRIYPTLAELIELFPTLQRIKENTESNLSEMPKSVKRNDLESNSIIYEPLDLNKSDIQA